MKIPLCVLFTAAIVSMEHSALIASDETVSAVPSAKTVLDRIKASRNVVSNGSFEVLWRSKADDQAHRWEKQTYVFDELGRKRLICEYGPISNDEIFGVEADPAVSDTLYNGEMLMAAKYYPERDRRGAPRGKSTDEPVKGPKGYSSAIIGDSNSPLISALRSHRNPFDYIRNAAMPLIEKAIGRQAVAVQLAENRRIELTVTHSELDKPLATTVIVVNPERNWEIESLKSYGADGGMVRELVIEYQRQEDGLWVPRVGHDRRWNDRPSTAKPSIHWSFEVTKAICNDPAFNDDVFAIRLRPDTAVSDTRFRVNYRIGEQAAVSAELAKYAEKARMMRPGHKEPWNSEQKPSRLRWFLLTLNVAVIIGIATMLIARRIVQRDGTSS